MMVWAMRLWLAVGDAGRGSHHGTPFGALRSAAYRQSLLSPAAVSPPGSLWQTQGSGRSHASCVDGRVREGFLGREQEAVSWGCGDSL
jgi:hypothetical protein